MTKTQKAEMEQRAAKKAAIALELQAAKEALVKEANKMKQTGYDLVADRVLKAVTEMNAALDAAHKCAEMRVFLKIADRTHEHALRFEPLLYRLTHSTTSMVVHFRPDQEQAWRVIKDPAFEDAAGVGLDALKKKDGNAPAVAKAT